jgi:hypothetical protein
MTKETGTMYHGCENCGSRVYEGYCVNCHEEVFIAQQYEIDGEPVPDILLDRIAEF